VDYICDTAIILADEDYRIVAILAIAGLSAFAHKTCRDGEKTAPMETPESFIWQTFIVLIGSIIGTWTLCRLTGDLR
jgi:hypothetical protein